MRDRLEEFRLWAFLKAFGSICLLVGAYRNWRYE